MITSRFFWVFILSFLMEGNVYAKNCTKGKACGNTCIARSKECHVGSGSSSSSSFDYSRPSYSAPRRSSYSSPRRSRRKKSSNRYTPTASYTSPRRFSPSNTSENQEKKKKSPVTISAVVSKILNSDTLETNKKGHKRRSTFRAGSKSFF